MREYSFYLHERYIGSIQGESVTEALSAFLVLLRWKIKVEVEDETKDDKGKNK